MDVAIGGDARGCKFGTGTAEKGNGRRLHGCGEMHGAGVVSENTAAGGERGGKIAQGGFPREIGTGAGRELGENFAGDSLIT